MSHFTVMVIGPDPETQLEPFDENIDGPEVKTGDVTEEEKQKFIDYYAKENPEDKDLSFAQLYELHGVNWNGGSWREEDGVWSEFSTYNPDSKWDWYSLGGRWTGMLKLKPGADGEVGDPGIMTEPAEAGHVDQAYKKDIDFEGMRDDDGEDAKKRYEEVEAAFGGVIPKVHTWKEIRENHPDISIDENREMYRKQPAIIELQRLQKEEKLGHFFDLDNYQITKEEYIQDARNNAVSTFAILKDGVWYERGDMGWWGMVSNEKDIDEWVNECNKLIDSLPDDTLISIYDCHI